MRATRGVEDEPLNLRVGRVARAKRLPSRAFEALLGGLGRMQPAPGGDDRDLWLMILASDPDGIWYPWPTADRRPPLDDAAR